jgi:hypothetical protein
MCPSCRAFITIGDRVCPYCGVQLGPRAVDMRPSEFAASFLPQANLTSIIILVINVAFFLAELAVNYRLYKNFDISQGVAVRKFPDSLRAANGGASLPPAFCMAVSCTSP